jgi:hypothetical protein
MMYIRIFIADENVLQRREKVHKVSANDFRITSVKVSCFIIHPNISLCLPTQGERMCQQIEGIK